MCETDLWHKMLNHPTNPVQKTTQVSVIGDDAESMRTYIVKVHTGKIHRGGTDAIVTIHIYGSKHNVTSQLVTSETNNNPFETDQVDIFTLKVNNIGTIMKISVAHDGTGLFDDWFLEKIDIEDEKSKVTYTFTSNVWVYKNDVKTLQIQKIHHGIQTPTAQDTFCDVLTQDASCRVGVMDEMCTHFGSKKTTLETTTAWLNHSTSALTMQAMGGQVETGGQSQPEVIYWLPIIGVLIIIVFLMIVAVFFHIHTKRRTPSVMLLANYQRHGNHTSQTATLNEYKQSGVKLTSLSKQLNGTNCDYENV
ncbi:uncharacterized protein LOC144724448 [Lampetra planeri]